MNLSTLRSTLVVDGLFTSILAGIVLAIEKGSHPKPFQFADPRQERIYRRLREIGPGPAAFFRDACRIMADPADLEATSHLVSHLLREIESALRHVLETMTEREDRLKKSKKGGGNHEEEIRAILRGLQVPETDPVSKKWLRLPGTGNDYGLAARAHRAELASPRPVDGTFRQFWDDIQGIFDVVLEKYETHYLGVFHFLDQLLAKPIPDAGDVDKLKNNVPHNFVAHSYFFDRLTSPAWLNPLQASGLFDHPPAPEVDVERGTTAYSRWPQSGYLARIADQVPEKVLEIMQGAPETNNFRIHQDLAEAAAAMPADLAAKWSDREAIWVNEQQWGLALLPGKLGTLINYLLQGGQYESAFNLARVLLDILPAPRVEEKQEGYILPPDPRARFSDWEYKRILKRMILSLPPQAKKRAFVLFCDLLEKAITLSRRPSEEPDPEDYSRIWHPDLENPRDGHSMKSLLVPAVREVALALVADDPTQVQAVVQELDKRQYVIFHRISLDLVRRYPDMAISLISGRLTDHSIFDARGLRREYDLLARECFAKLKSEEQRTILKWIEAGPDVEAYKQFHPELSGHEVAEEEVARFTKAWQRDRLAPFHESLSSDWMHHYDELVNEVGTPESLITKNPEVVSWVGPTSPKTVDDFNSMNLEEIVAYLGAWEPPREPMSPSRVGLGRQLTEAVRKTPMRFSAEATKFQGLDPTYVRAFLQGILEAGSEASDLAWPEILRLCLWVIQQPLVIEGRQVDKWGDDPDWGWTRKVIAGLLGAGLQEGPSMIPFHFRDEVWKILEVLTDDLDPTPDDEIPQDGLNDPSHLSINTTRGAAMHTLMRYALWVRQHLDKEADGKERIAQGFKEMPEVQRVLEAHLDQAKDPSLAIRSVYGQWFPWLTLLDAEWAKNHTQTIFPHEDSSRQYRDAAWDTYIVFCRPDGSVIDILREEYAIAVEQLGSPSTTYHGSDAETRLAQHLMVFYWQGRLDLGEADGLLARFYDKATDVLLGEALEFVGSSLRDTHEPLPADMSMRLQDLWAARLVKIRRSPTPANHVRELAAFGWWFVSQKFDSRWSIAQLLEVLSLAQKAEPDHLVVERLVAIAATMPLEAVQCLDLMVQGDKEGWNIAGWRDDARKILATAIASGNPTGKQAATDLVNRLAARGILDYADLLSAAGKGG